MSRKPAINYVIILVFMLYIMGISIPGMSQSDAASKTKPAPPTEQVDPNPVPDPVDPTPIDPEPTIQAANIKPAAKPTADVVTLNKTSTTIFVGGREQLIATSTISNPTFKWQSSNPLIATVDKNGLVRGIAPGTADITVTSNKGGTATCSVTVTAVAVTGVTLDQTNITLTAIGQTRTLTATVSPTNATDKAVTWSSLDPAVATVDAAGIVTAVAEGNTSVTATTVDGGFTASCTVTVDPTVLLVPVTGVTLNQTVMALTALGAPGTLTATVAPADATNASVTWLSSDILVATVAGGVVTPLKPGTTIITATTVDGGFTATCTVTVSPPVKWIAVTGVTLDQATMTLATMGTTGTLIATVAPLNASDPTVHWSSSDIAVATVAGGIVTPLAPGTSTITATTVDGNFTAACLVTVQDITATPVINTPVASAQTSVSGTAEADSVITLSINGTAQPTVTAAGGIWTVIDLTLAVGDIIEVTAQAPDKWVSAAASTTVAEAQPPVIQLIGSDPDSVTVGSTVYADPGAVANDPIYGNLTSSIEVTGTVDTNTVGSYTLTYTVTNPATISRSVTRTVDVVDTLDPTTIDQFVTPLLVPWAMPKSPSPQPGVDYYEIAMRQFDQQILPAGMPATTVWGYGSATDSGAVFNAPSLTIEAKADRPVRVKWINDLIDDNGNYLPHLLPIDQNIRQVSLNEEESESPATPGIAPKAAKLGILDGMGMPVALAWMDPVTEVVSPGDTEIWEIYNATMDAHPIHLHLVTFEVIERQAWDMETGDLGEITPAQSWEAGFKDTVLAYPDQVTRIKAKFDMAGRYVWHCHILEHEDNEMMRPYLVAPPGSDTRAPVITVLGNNPETVALNSTYIDAGAAAVDNFDGNVSHNIVVDNQVDTAVAGMYMVHYSVTDSSGNTAMAMRTVMVTDEGPMARMLAAEDGEPVISLNKQVLSLTALGKNGKLKVDIDAPDDSELELVWSSSDPDVATVEDGIVTPLSAGVAIITVSTEDGSYSASCEVTVLPPSTKGKRK